MAGAVAAVIGAWLMLAPAVVPHTSAAATNLHVVGPVVITFGVCAVWPVMRALHWGNVLAGGWLIVSAVLVFESAPAAFASSVLCGFALIALAIPGRIYPTHRYGGGWRAVLRGPG